MSRLWSPEEEVTLFSLVCDHKPAGPHADERVQVIVQGLNTKSSGADFTAADVLAKLELHFNMKEVNDIENESEIDKQATAKASHVEPEADNDPCGDIYSSELSDVEGDVEDLADLNDEEVDPLKTAQIIRGRRKFTVAKTKDAGSEEPATKKRKRSLAKRGGNEASNKRRKLRSNSSASKVKRKTRSEFSPDPSASTAIDLNNEKKSYLDPEGQETETQEPEETIAPGLTPEELHTEESSKKRRSTRQSVRRSVRKK